MDLWSVPHRSQFVTGLLPLLSRTTDISAAMLEQECRSRDGEQSLALSQTNVNQLSEAILKVAESGHSSGHDMLYGIAFALESLVGSVAS